MKQPAEHENLAVERLPEGESKLAHVCEDGHGWTEFPDGTVSPSYGLGGTHLSWLGHDPATCPEPDYTLPDQDRESYDYEANVLRVARAVRCPECGVADLPFNLLSGLSCTPWVLAEEAERTGHVHSAPLPVCGKPPVQTLRWMKVKRLLVVERKGAPGEYDYKPRWTCDWLPVEGTVAAGEQMDLLAGVAS